MPNIKYLPRFDTYQIRFTKSEWRDFNNICRELGREGLRQLNDDPSSGHTFSLSTITFWRRLVKEVLEG